MTPLVHYLYSLTLSRVEIHILRGRHPHLKPRYKWCYLLSSVYNLSGPLAAACPATTNNGTTLSCQSRVGIKIVQLLKVITFFGFLIALAFTYFRMLRYTQTPFWKRSSRLHLPSPFLPPTVSNWLSEILQ